MAKELISDIFDEPKVKAQIDAVLKGLNDVASTMQRVQQMGEGAKSAKTFEDSSKAAAQLAEQLKKLESQQARITQLEEQLAKALAESAAKRSSGNKTLTESEKLQKQYEQTMGKLNATLTKEAELLAQSRVAMAEVNKQLKEQAKDALGLTNAYDKLQKEFNEAAREAKIVGATLGDNSREFKDAAAKANELNNKLKAIDAGIGNYQRNVGNYASGFQNFNQVLRETPAFANSVQTGLMALGNNLPMFADEIKKARGEGQSWGQILKSLGQNLFSFGGIVTILTTALVFLPKIVEAVSGSFGKQTDAAKAMSAAHAEAQKSVASEIAELQGRLSVARDVTKSDQVRRDALSGVNKMLGEHSKQLTLNNVNTKEADTIIKQHIETLSKYALAEAYVSQIAAQQAKIIDIKTKSSRDSLKWYQEAIVMSLELGNALTKNEKIQRAALAATNKFAAENKAEDLKKENKTLEQIQADFFKALENGEALFKDSSTKNAQNKAKDLSKIEQERLDAEFEMGKRRLEYLIKLNQDIADNENNSQATRLASLSEAEKLRGELLKLERRKALEEIRLAEQQEIKEAKGNKAEINSIIKAYAAERLKIETDFRYNSIESETEYLKSINELNAAAEKERQDKAKKDAEKREKDRKEAVDKEFAAIGEQQLRNQEFTNNALQEINLRYLNGEFKTYEDYLKERNAITDKYAIEGIKGQIAATMLLLQNSKLSTDERTKAEQKLAELKKQLTEAEIAAGKRVTDENKKEQEKRRQNLLQTLNAIQQGVQTVFAAIEAINSIGYEKSKQRLDAEKQQIEERYAREVENINNSTISEQQKAIELQKLEANKQVQLEANERKRRQLEIERAKFERARNIANIITGTAIAVVSALGAQPFTPGNIVLASLIGALGAAQLAKAIATPLPKYAKGTDNHKGGLAVVGDGGKSELVVTPDGKAFVTPSTDTVVDLPKGSKVFPDASDIDKIMLQAMFKNTVASIGNKKDSQEDRQLMEWQTKQIVNAIKKQKPSKSVTNVTFGRDLYLYKQVFE